MNSLTFFLLVHLIFSVVSGIAEGGGGIQATTLTSDITATTTTIPVEDTTYFLKSDYIVIGDEYIRYGNKSATSFDASVGFLGATSGRGYSNTEAVAHSAGTRVYSSQADPLNAIMGFNVMATADTLGSVNILTLAPRVLTTTMPRLVTWDYGILQVGVMTYVRLGLQILGGAFILYLVLSMFGAFGRR